MTRKVRTPRTSWPCCEFPAGARTICVGTAYDYQRWTKIGCCRLGSQSRCKGVQGLGPLRLPLLREQQAAFDGLLFCHATIFPVQAATDGVCGFQYRRLFLGTTPCVEKTWCIFSPLVAQETFQRAFPPNSAPQQRAAAQLSATRCAAIYRFSHNEVALNNALLCKRRP